MRQELHEQPLEQPPEQPPEQPREALIQVARKSTVLLVDDDRDALGAMRKLLEVDYRVLTADTGHRALEIAREHDLNLIVLDALMPQLDGYETLKALKAMKEVQGVPVLFLTASHELEKELQALDQGAVDFITKPCEPRRFLARIKHHLSAGEERAALQERSSTDALTGLSNRYELAEALDREWQAAMRNGTPLSIALLDVDHFKSFNDIHGHSVGDMCLREVADAIDSHVNRPHDLAARFGGEEFLVLLPNTDFPAAWNVAEAIRRAVESNCLQATLNGISPGNVTVSAGVACHRPQWVKGQPDAEYASLVELADKNLYSAKRRGRNCVVGSDYRR